MMRAHSARLHAQLATHRRAVALAEHIVCDALDRAPSWYVSLSGGKDSTVVLDMVRRLRPDAPAVAFVQKWMLPETVSYLRSIPNVAYVAANDHRDNDYADGRWQNEGDARAAWPGVTWLPWTDAAADHRYGRDEDGAFLGLRADESRGRRMNLRTRGAIYYNHTSSQWIATPIAHWTVMDVWAYLMTRNVPYNAAYDVMERIGVPLERQRVAEFMIDRVVGYGTLTTLKRGWPDVFNHYVNDHPEARNYV